MKCFTFAILAAFIAVISAGKIEQDPAALENPSAAKDTLKDFKCPQYNEVHFSRPSEEKAEEAEDGEKEEGASGECQKNAKMTDNDVLLLYICGIYDKNNISKLKEFVTCDLETEKVLVNGAFNDNAIINFLQISKDEVGLYINECGSIQGENELDTNFEKYLCYKGFFRSRLPILQ